MSFQEEKRDSIIRYMLEKIDCDDDIFIKKTSENYDISATSVKRYINKCLNENIIIQNTNAKCGYTLVNEIKMFKFDTNNNLDEDRIYYENMRPIIEDASKEALTIWSYVFMEIMNNAIEHSLAKNIWCNVKKNFLYTEISICDDGVGIYKKIKEYLEEELKTTVSTEDVIAELYKGKLTTDTDNHSGEGIFFSSKMLREFAIQSENKVFWESERSKNNYVESHLISYYSKMKSIGTIVIMKLENVTKKNIKEVFEMYAPIEEGFVKTIIPLKEICPYGEPIARSQARRIVYRLEQFKVVEFDFSEIDFMGQGFADEVFRVFQNKYPDIKLVPVNANESVLGMIKHVQNTV